jgi:hypothetical protein
MSPKLKRLSGKDVVSIFAGFGFVIHSQKGSHAKLRRVLQSGERQPAIYLRKHCIPAFIVANGASLRMCLSIDFTVKNSPLSKLRIDGLRELNVMEGSGCLEEDWIMASFL